MGLIREVEWEIEESSLSPANPSARQWAGSREERGRILLGWMSSALCQLQAQLRS